MSKTKAGGSSKNLRDSNPKFLGNKSADGEMVKSGAILVRQRGTRIMPGTNVGVGKDHTLFATTNGTVHYRTVRKKHFDGTMKQKKQVSVAA